MSGPQSSALAAAPEPASATSSWALRSTAILIVAFLLHRLCWSSVPPDMGLFLLPWFDHLVRYGPVGAFAHPFSNYEPAYLYLLALASTAHGLLAPMYIIKTLSVLGTAFLALAVGDLLKATGSEAKYGILVFVLPSVVINAAMLGQCDALWGGACVLAVSAMIRGWTVRSLIWCGVAIAFKAQAAFIAPFIIGALIGRRAPLWPWAIPAVVFGATLVPAMLMGWPAWDLLMVYPGQANWVHITGRLANPWIAATLFAPYAARDYFLIGYVAAAAAAVAIAAAACASIRNPRAMLALALLCAAALPFLLPKMLERYYFLADVLALALALSLRSRAAILVAIAIQVASILTHASYMYSFDHPYPTLLGTVFAAAALWGTYVIARRSGAEWPALPRLPWASAIRARGTA